MARNVYSIRLHTPASPSSRGRFLSHRFGRMGNYPPLQASHLRLYEFLPSPRYKRTAHIHGLYICRSARLQKTTGRIRENASGLQYLEPSDAKKDRAVATQERGLSRRLVPGPFPSLCLMFPGFQAWKYSHRKVWFKISLLYKYGGV